MRKRERERERKRKRKRKRKRERESCLCGEIILMLIDLLKSTFYDQTFFFIVLLGCAHWDLILSL